MQPRESSSAELLEELRSTVQTARREGLRSLTTHQLERLPDLYRFAASLLARLQAGAGWKSLSIPRGKSRDYEVAKDGSTYRPA